MHFLSTRIEQSRWKEKGSNTSEVLKGEKENNSKEAK